MKKIFTIFAAALFAVSTFAQGYELNDNRILKTYKDYDGLSFTTSTTKQDNSKIFGNALKYLEFPLGGESYNQSDLNKIILTQDYTDPETGFTVKAGTYSTVCNQTITDSNSFSINFYTEDQPYMSNIKKMIVYLGGVGTASYQECRVTSTRIYTNGALYNNGIGGDESTLNWLGKSVNIGVIGDDATIDCENRTYQQSKLFRLVIDFATPHDPDDQKEFDGKQDRSANDGDNPTEKTKTKCVDANGKATCDEYVYNVAHKFVDATGDGTTGKGGVPGYHSYEFGTGKSVGFPLQLKKYFNLFGVAFITCENDAKTYIGDTSLGKEAIWVEMGTPSGINAVNAETTKVAPRKQLVNGQIVIGDYNIAGQRVK